MNCGSCGAAIEPGARFCASCGAPVAASACRNCGAELAPGARFCASCGTAVEDGGRPQTADRERKVATLVFADLVGYTSLNEGHDPEIIEAVVGRAFDRLSAEVERYEGLVEKFAGDAMLAVFGVPTVHEDDAERAVRAAFEMQQAMVELGAQLTAEGRPQLQLRIGIETGEVLANRQRATTDRDRIVTGDAVNSAARLEQAAQPGEIVVGPATYAATRDVVDYEELPAQALKGKALPIAAWRATRVRAGHRGRRATLGLEAPMVGRDEELTLLKETVRRTATEGRPHLVTVLGSAGVGKSRLTWELEKYLDGLPDNFHWRKGRCLAYAQASYSALADAVAADASVLEDDPPDAVEAKVDARLVDLAGGTAPPEVGAAIRVLLGLSASESLPKVELFEAWRMYLELVARRYPLVLVLEDIHWADEGLLDFIEFLARWADAPIMLLCLARHELLERRSSWAGGLPNATSIVLEPLSAQESGRLLSGLLGAALPAELERRVIEVSEGNPLFAEELVRLFVDRGVVRHTESGWEQAQPIEEVEIPQSIQALLAARLDSLPAEEKRLSQDAAVVGRIFWDRLLAHLAGQSPAATVGLLRSLRVKELVVPREPSTLTDAQEYAFRHVLIRDVAYDSLPKLERARKHREVAEWAEERLGERADEVVELLAAHYWSALRYEEEFATDEAALEDLRRRTMQYADAAARRALLVSQFESTTEWLRIVMAQARRLPLEPMEFATAVLPYVRLTETETHEARLGVAREAIDRLLTQDVLTDDARKMVADLRGFEAYCAFSSGSDPVDVIRARLESALELLDGIGPCVERASALRWLGWLAWRGGPFIAAEEPLRRSLEEAQAAGDDRTERWAMHDLGIVLTRGAPDPEGLALLMRSYELAREAKDVFLVSRCYINLPGTLVSFGRFEEAMTMAGEGFELARRTGDHNARFWVGSNLADFYHGRGRLPEAIATREEALEAARRVGLQPTAGLEGYAFTLISAGRFDDARAVWERIQNTEHVVEPQHAATEAVVDALLLWPHDPADAIRRIRDGIVTTREAMRGEGLDLLTFYLSRMGLKAGDADAVRDAAALADELPDAATVPFTTSLARWFRAVAREQAGDDPAGAVREIVDAAEDLEAQGWRLLAADAFADATFLADRHRLPGGNEWSARARAIYESGSAVPVLDALRSSVS
ncbi:MAG TPA: adenylate/guanylate cyclase domain-containing protein [Candidatus Limnocylindria bacterium]|nr:adenylate/guanylate cyclase domain-containing protein [Candidatus Limnocylindria bacterium]